MKGGLRFWVVSDFFDFIIGYEVKKDVLERFGRFDRIWWFS